MVEKELSEVDALRLENLQLKAEKALAHAAMYQEQYQNMVNQIAERDGLIERWHLDVANRRWVRQ